MLESITEQFNQAYIDLKKTRGLQTPLTEGFQFEKDYVEGSPALSQENIRKVPSLRDVLEIISYTELSLHPTRLYWLTIYGNHQEVVWYLHHHGCFPNPRKKSYTDGQPDNVISSNFFQLAYDANGDYGAEIVYQEAHPFPPQQRELIEKIRSIGQSRVSNPADLPPDFIDLFIQTATFTRNRWVRKSSPK